MKRKFHSAFDMHIARRMQYSALSQRKRKIARLKQMLSKQERRTTKESTIKRRELMLYNLVNHRWPTAHGWDNGDVTVTL